MVAKAKPTQATVPVEYKVLIGMLGKPLTDPELQALLARSGTVKVQKPRRDGHYVFCKHAGYTLLLEPEPGAARGAPMLVSQIFLHYPGQDRARGFAFPHGLAHGQTQPEVRKLLGKPRDASNPFADSWARDGVTFTVSYSPSFDDAKPKTLCDLRITPA